MMHQQHLNLLASPEEMEALPKKAKTHDLQLRDARTRPRPLVTITPFELAHKYIETHYPQEIDFGHFL